MVHVLIILVHLDVGLQLLLLVVPEQAALNASAPERVARLQVGRLLLAVPVLEHEEHHLAEQLIQRLQQGVVGGGLVDALVVLGGGPQHVLEVKPAALLGLVGFARCLVEVEVADQVVRDLDGL